MTIPVLVVGGYLGAGKTTLINRLLCNADGRRITVLVNDFGSINIDADLIENRNGDTISLTNGCACCTIGNDLLDAARKAAKGAPEMLMVEASGVAEPDRMVMTLLGVKGLEAAEKLTVVDGSTMQQRMRDKFVGKLVTSQIAAAGMIFLNRTPTDHRDATRLRGLIEATAPAAKMLKSPDDVLEFSRNRPAKPDASDEQIGVAKSPSPVGLETATVTLTGSMELERLKTVFKELPVTLHRAKGFVRIRDGKGQDSICELQYSGNQLTVRPAKPVSEKTIARLILIGTESAQGMAVISARLKDALALQST